MKILSDAKWKQKIVFDNVLYKEVKRYSLSLSTMERKIMESEIEYYRSHFSLIQIMNYFKTLKSKKDKEIFIKLILKRSEYLLFTPDSLVPYFKKLIKEEYSEYSGFFNVILERSRNASDYNYLIPVYKNILGKYYGYVKRRINKVSKQKEVRLIQKPLKPEALENTARNLIAGLQANSYIGRIFGRCTFRKTLPISVVDEYGYGEWKSKNVSFNTNRFFLYSNNNKLTPNELEHMVYFNVYPGYGHFYNSILEDNHKINFDNGATFLINGWAMYAMCNSTNSAHANSMLVEGSIIAKNLLRTNLRKGYENIYIYLLGKYPKQKAIDYMLDYVSYPGHYMSYILGNFATEGCMKKGFANNPIDYLKCLRDINCGDFFAIYHPSVQKKIARKSITAKVSYKYQK